ncbi:hypothetical protein GCM10023189_18330 [Nibrella saemangeumensis]|uniref:Fatty acid desaturase domain-containing protein n=2 Tax=Nibrella saemangeumensis TaxID=1084526 RepID=A0ABP8MQJ7_9BACT
MGDPTHKRMIAYLSSASDAKLQRFNFMWSIYVPFIAFNERLALWMLPFKEWQQSDRSKGTKKEITYQIGYLLAYACFGLAIWQLGIFTTFLIWFLPASLLLLVIEENINLPHHIDAPHIDTQKPLALWEQDVTTHSCDTIPFWSDWVLLNFNMHTAHHLFPWVPWYKLPRTQQHIERYTPELGHENTNEFSWFLNRRSESFTSKFREFIQK